MVAKKLGRGLDALIRKTEEGAGSAADELEIRRIDPRLIAVNRAQPRSRFDDEALEELAASIRTEGILQPLVVRKHEAGGFELIAGERRLRASLKLNLAEVPVVIRTFAPDSLLELALVENIQREDLNPIELARAYRQLREQNGWTQADLAERLGKKRSSVANSLRFLELPETMQESLAIGEISAGHAKILLSLEADARQTHYHAVVQNKLSVRELEERIRSADAATPDSHPKPAPQRRRNEESPPHMLELENELSSALGTRATIRPGSRGRGKIILEYYTNDDFQRLRRMLTHTVPTVREATPPSQS